ncbi:hypothetical protein M8C21_008066, partial [Ambrosia artemisiifolia]
GCFGEVLHVTLTWHLVISHSLSNPSLACHPNMAVTTVSWLRRRQSWLRLHTYIRLKEDHPSFSTRTNPSLPLPSSVDRPSLSSATKPSRCCLDLLISGVACFLWIDRTDGEGWRMAGPNLQPALHPWFRDVKSEPYKEMRLKLGQRCYQISCKQRPLRLDFIRDPDSRRFRVIEKTKEEEELEEFVSFELNDEEGLHHVNQEMEAKTAALLGLDRSKSAQAPANKGSYSQVGLSYDGDVTDENQDSDDDEDDDDDMDEEDFNSDDSNDEGMDIIAKEFGVKRYRWLVYMDKKTKEEESRQKEIVKGDPAIVCINTF